MTNEQAIIELRDLISDDRTDNENEALLLAIEKLREARPDVVYLCKYHKEPHYCKHTHRLEDALNFEEVAAGHWIEKERPHGKWEEDWQEDLDFMSRKGWKCPFCKWRTSYGTPNFCMNCGADLRKGDET